MHIDYAKELVCRAENDSFIRSKSDWHILNSVICEELILKLLDSSDDEKMISIAGKIRDINNNRYSHITNAMKHSVFNFLISRYGSARAVLSSAYGKTEYEMFGEVIEKDVAYNYSALPENLEKMRAEAKAMNNFIGAKPLVGTEKQIAWAETIRARMLKIATQEQAEVLIKRKEATNARFWIDNRESTICVIVRLLS